MADASAISNTLRQLAGSLAIAFLSLVMTSHNGANAYAHGITVDFTTLFAVSILTLIPLFFIIRRSFF